MPFVSLPNLKMHFEHAGDGPAAVVLVHGNFASWRWWLPLLQDPPAGYTLYAPEMRGYGDSERTPDGYSVEQFAQDLNGFTGALGLERFHLVGHSLGGAVALQYALLFPGRLESLFLVSPAPAQGMPNLTVDFKTRYVMNLPPLSGTEDLPPFLGNSHVNRAILSRVLTSITPQLDHDNPSFFALIEDAVRVAPETVQGVVRSLQNWNVEKQLPGLYLPVMILWGDRDPVIERRPLERMAAVLPRAELIVWEGTGHAPQLEQPERFRSLLSLVISGSAAIGEPDRPEKSSGLSSTGGLWKRLKEKWLDG
jgi:3-oxoadipate enol-lactonase